MEKHAELSLDKRPGDPGEHSGVVAVVDDDPGVALALQTWLNHLSIPVQTFGEGSALLESLQTAQQGWQFCGASGAAGQPLIGLVIDLNLPGPNGFQIARQLLDHAPGLPVVVITAAGDDSQRLLGGVPPGVTCLSKPFDLDVLEAALLRRIES
jgi:CheY-like chemotaxis protein